MLKVVKIRSADVYRDGGSYGFCFDADDGNQYEFFLKTAAFEPSLTKSHHSPVIYLGDVSDKQIVRGLSWEEADVFIASLQYENSSFTELVAIVKGHGKFPPQ